ncbi:MAG: amidohydrolase family protein [Planctomycetes bacterium]|nr:amidohydrolase family protein [Planctomycetota bacterium]
MNVQWILGGLVCATLGTTALAFPSAQDKDERKAWVVRAEKIYTSTGRAIDKGTITVNNGKISSVTTASDVSDSTSELKVYAVTAGLVDASARIGVSMESVEQSREVAPEMRVANAIDLHSPEWDRQVACGVTTVLVNPPDYDVVGGLGIVLKTAGGEGLAARTLKPDAVLRGAIGSQPSQNNHPAFGRPTDFYSRRPTTRMGVEWEWRKAFWDTAQSKQDPSKAFPGMERLADVLEGKLTLSIQAWTTQDIRTAVFLKEEMEREGLGKPRLFIDAAAEAWKEPQLLARSKTPVVLPPFPVVGRTEDGAFMAWNVAQLLVEQGIPVALSAHGASSFEDRLAMQAGYAMRGGLSFENALQAVTIQPARLLGVEERVGSIEVGKDADLALWNGEPFEPTSRVVGVIVDGVLRVDPRPKN